MPFDGIVTKCISNELNSFIFTGRVEKIFQPENDEILLNIRANSKNYKLIISANASFPRIHFTENSKENPAVPPMFCMLLRKHIAGGRICGIDFHDYERIITIRIESVNEMGDLSEKKLVVEIMGKHSNIILLNDENRIIDSIKHIDKDISSFREVMPARLYQSPPPQNKINPKDLICINIFELLNQDSDITLDKFLLNNIKGFSPYTCREIYSSIDIDEKQNVNNLSEQDKTNLLKSLNNYILKIESNSFVPTIFFKDKEQKEPSDFYCFSSIKPAYSLNLPTMSEVLDRYYQQKDLFDRLKQKSIDLQKLLKNNLDRCNRKLALHSVTLRECESREALKLYGELITANIYSIASGSVLTRLQNYYDDEGKFIDIVLDEKLSPQDNAQKYFKQYNKAKKTYTQTLIQQEDCIKELEYLESVQLQLENCSSLKDIEEIREELAEQSYISIKQTNTKKKRVPESAPIKYISSDGFEILVGKNNKQNDLLTMKQASSNDIWLHTQKIPGSHVIIRKLGKEIPNSTLLEAATLSALHSKAKMSSLVTVDYTLVKSVKKPPGAKPGMVIYENFKSIIVTPDENLIKLLRK